MFNFKMTLSYDGEKYNGWQRQNSTDNTIQGKMEGILSRYFGEEIEVNASGRTDAGVHALGQVANFKIHESNKKYKEIRSDSGICRELNKYLPKDISILSIERVDERFHARLNAKSKHYRYSIDIGDAPKVFERKYLYRLKDDLDDRLVAGLDIDRMKRAAEIIVGEHDFKSFTSMKKTKKSTVRNVYKIDIELNNGILTFDYFGDGFLYNMIRIISGTLLEVGIGKKNVDAIEKIFEACDRSKAGFLAPPQGLMLIEVFY